MKIETYLKKNKTIKSLEKIELDYRQYFIQCVDDNALNYISDYHYIEGAIIIEYNDEILLGFQQWDLVDQLWTYIIEAIELIIYDKEEVGFFFPDQPIKVQIKKMYNHYVLFSVDKNSILVEKNEFFSSLLDGAERFFGILKYVDSSDLMAHSEKMLKKICSCKKEILKD